jgi:ABC-2 type transport system ATP-binding protein
MSDDKQTDNAEAGNGGKSSEEKLEAPKSKAARDVVLSVTGIEKTFKKPFSGRKVEAVRGVTFEVRRGEIFGFLGPNGAGKTTTIKMLTGLIAPTGGSAKLFGEPAPSAEAMRLVGFLPENPYIYPYLTPREFVELCGRLNGLTGKHLASRTEAVLERVGIGYAMDRPVRALSKGMTQRAGLAAAMVHEPQLLLLDEPMSGLDPVGRKEVRDIILEERAEGRTVFFSSHILGDVETLCDRVCILKKGEVVVAGSIDELLGTGPRHVEITLKDASTDLAKALTQLGKVNEVGSRVVVDLEGDEQVKTCIEKAFALGATVESVVPKRETLEDVFVRRAL